ncbi:hypothetical protein BCR44DRAFT_1436955 [Catenaria anguillulae PL171]|uniref:Rieske domain-containing protein n=1 Tax=Catenaria anguillulae PL171 TaxID=765915 RepID=A0A1Y2HHF0_9FUNG|nr:hypothetical protein BCR44DRAFT_1436955 [Catenaria anguillulae PL171]
MNRTAGNTKSNGSRGRRADTSPGRGPSSSDSSASSSESGSSSGYSSGSDTEMHQGSPQKTKTKPKSTGPLPGAPGSLLDSFLTHQESAAATSSPATNGAAVRNRSANVPVATLPEGAAGAEAENYQSIEAVPMDKKAAKKAAKQAKKQAKHSVANPVAVLGSASPTVFAYPLNGKLPVLSLLTALGATAASPWTEQEVMSDAVALSNARIRTVDDLRYVPKKGWKDLPVPQVVSDRLRRCVWAGMDKRHVREMEDGLLDGVGQELAKSLPSLPATLAARNTTQDGQPKRTIELEPATVTTNDGTTVAPRHATGGVHTKADDKPEGYWSTLASQFLGTASPAVDSTPRSPPSPPTQSATVNLDPSNPAALVNALLYDGRGGPQWVPPTLDEVMASSPKKKSTNAASIRDVKPAVAAALAAMDAQPENPTAASIKSTNGDTSVKLSATDLSSTELVHSLLHTGAMVAPTDANVPLDANENATGSGGGKTMPAAQQPQLGVVAGKPNRIRVTNGRQVFEVDRYCPHKQYDMLKAPAMRGNVLTCPKHDWDFDLAKGGTCVGRPGKSLNCVVVSDW